MDIKAEGLLESVIDRFKNVQGIDAVVLGGSRATGTFTDDSDIDLGIYYNRNFNLAYFKRVSAELDDLHRNDCITDIGEWGPWINGGGWLTIDKMPVDILFRETEKVRNTIDECMAGTITIDYQCGHPFGFVNAIYMGEAALCRILLEENTRLKDLKKSLAVFPPRYREASMEKFLWEGKFSLRCGRKAAAGKDVTYASGSLFRSAVCLIYAFYSFHGMYFINEKGSLSRLKKSGAGLPDGFSDTLEETACVRPDNITELFGRMEQLYAESEDYMQKK
jgi:predicted nucleotidyltransferase